MISRCVALVVSAIALVGCCTSSGGCYAPAAAVAPVVWNDSGPVAAGNGGSDAKPRQRDWQKREIVGPLNATAAAPNAQPEAKDRWAQEQAADQEADAKLNSQLKICRGC
jgi:hypothetical protein